MEFYNRPRCLQQIFHLPTLSDHAFPQLLVSERHLTVEVPRINLSPTLSIADSTLVKHLLFLFLAGTARAYSERYMHASERTGYQTGQPAGWWKGKSEIFMHLRQSFDKLCSITIIQTTDEQHSLWIGFQIFQMSQAAGCITECMVLICRKVFCTVRKKKLSRNGDNIRSASSGLLKSPLRSG